MWFPVRASYFHFYLHLKVITSIEHQQFNVILIKSSLSRATCFTVQHESKNDHMLPTGLRYAPPIVTLEVVTQETPN